MLNCFSYSGGFGVAAASLGAKTTSVDVSSEAISLARENFRLNGLKPEEHRFVVQSAYDFLGETNEKFDLIVLDPPAFVKKRQHLEKGSRAYKEINRLAIGKLSRGGLLFTCSCSSHVSWDLFQKILFAAAKDTGLPVQIIGRFGQPPDHPVNIYHPEGEYLKTFLLSID
jgi:23S rRNA (cytosine1962-C5)-methyltransferase